jgi:hypothetical protein
MRKLMAKMTVFGFPCLLAKRMTAAIPTFGDLPHPA